MKALIEAIAVKDYFLRDGSSTPILTNALSGIVDTVSEAKGKLQVNVYDDTGSLDVCNAVKCLELYNTGDAGPIEEINESHTIRRFLMMLREKKNIWVMLLCTTTLS